MTALRVEILAHLYLLENDGTGYRSYRKIAELEIYKTGKRRYEK